MVCDAESQPRGEDSSTGGARPGEPSGTRLGQYHRERFGPVEVELWGPRGLLALDVGASAPVRLTWSDDVADAVATGATGGTNRTNGTDSTAGAQTVGSRLATLLRTSGGPVSLDRPEQIRVPGDGKTTDPVPRRPSILHSLTVEAIADGVSIEVIIDVDVMPADGAAKSAVADGSAVAVSVLLPVDAAYRLADLLDAWSAHRLLSG